MLKHTESVVVVVVVVAECYVHEDVLEEHECLVDLFVQDQNVDVVL